VLLALLALLAVIGVGPAGVTDRHTRPLHDALAQEFRAGPTPVHPARAPATLGHRGDAEILLHRPDRIEALALAAQGGQQPRGKGGSGSGQATEDEGIRVPRECLRDGRIVLLDAGITLTLYYLHHFPLGLC